MQRYIAARALQGLVALSVVIVVIFVLSRLSGNPVDLMLPPDATQADRDKMTQDLGLDQPYYVQFATYIAGVARLDFGSSIRLHRPVTEVFLERLPNTLKLVAVAYILAVLIAIPLGVIAAQNRGTLLDGAAGIMAVIGMVTPQFWLGLVLIQLLAVTFGLLPVAGMGGPSHWVMPALTLSFYQVAGLMRLLRSSMLDTLDAEFIKLARIKGVSERVVVWSHCLRNALVPVVSFAGLQISMLVTGAVVIETVFAWPGVGRLAYEAVMWRDFPLVQAVVALHAFAIVGFSLIVDVVYAYLDPRIRYS